MYRYKAQYSLDCENGIENAVLLKPQTPEMLLEEKQFQEQVYAAVMKLPEKQAKRIYARYYLGMAVNEIAEVEGVDPSRVRDSIRRGLKQLVKYFDKISFDAPVFAFLSVLIRRTSFPLLHQGTLTIK